MISTRVVLVGGLMTLLVLSLPPAFAEGTSVSTLERRLEQTARQRAENRKLLWEAALATAEAFSGAAVAVADQGSKNWERIDQIATEIKVAVQKDDAVRAAKLAAEAGRLVFLESVTKTAEVAKDVATVAKIVVNVPPGIFLAGQSYVQFAQRSADDERLLRSELALERQIAAARRATTTTGRSGSVPQTTSLLKKQTPGAVPAPNAAELDDAITLNRFFETKDWSVEDRKNIERIAAKYPDIDRQLQEALRRTNGAQDRRLDKAAEIRATSEALNAADAVSKDSKEPRRPESSKPADGTACGASFFAGVEAARQASAQAYARCQASDYPYTASLCQKAIDANDAYGDAYNAAVVKFRSACPGMEPPPFVSVTGGPAP